MSRNRVVVSLVVILAAVAAQAQSGSQQSFDSIKALTGNWEGKSDMTDPVQVSFRITAGGSAVMSEIVSHMDGKSDDMITMFNMDGDRLLLTHYCALQNAPVLRFEKSNKPGELKFVFYGGTNFDPKVDAHLHESTFQIKDGDTVEQNSTVFANGKPTPELHAILHRKSSN